MASNTGRVAGALLGAAIAMSAIGPLAAHETAAWAREAGSVAIADPARPGESPQEPAAVDAQSDTGGPVSPLFGVTTVTALIAGVLMLRRPHQG